MKTKLGTMATRSLLAAGLALGIASAHAGGYNVTRDQEQRGQSDMTASAIRAALGAPAAVQSYGEAGQQTRSYQVANATPAVPDGRAMFEIDFGANGQVIAASEFVVIPDSAGD